MKRSIAVFLALGLFFLAGCGGKAPEPSKIPEEELIVVGISQTGAESDWRVANSESMKAAFSEENGYRLLFDDARQIHENQIIAVRKFIQQQVDYIILLPLVETGWESVLQEARDADIPVIVVDRRVNVEDEALYTAQVGSNFTRQGERAVEWMEREYRVEVKDEALYTAQVGSDFIEQGERAVEWMEQEYDENQDSIGIVHIRGTLGSSAQLGRTAALEEAVQRHENWTLLVQLDGDFTQAKTYEALYDYLLTLPEDQTLNVVYCENDNEAFGAIQALEDLGYVCGRDVDVISFDATRNGLELCMAGKISLAVECNPLLGPLAEEIVQTLEAGKTPKKTHYIQEQIFTPDMLTEEFIAKREY